MAFIVTAPLVRAVYKAGGMGIWGAAAMRPDALQEAIQPACCGVDIIGRFSGIQVCVIATIDQSTHTIRHPPIR
jgi:NAD(P)H-dependent flavin oxidoreductase YrpB (nitropropane dioxygenase family)